MTKEQLHGLIMELEMQGAWGLAAHLRRVLEAFAK